MEVGGVRTRRKLGCVGKSDSGSGTMLGVMLMMILVAFCTMAALFSRALYAQEVSRIAADVAAVASAAAIGAGDSQGSACAAARHAAELNQAHIQQCVREGDDMSVSVYVAIVNIPGFSRAESIARAGPEECSKSAMPEERT